MKDFFKKINFPIFYVTPTVSRAIGLEELLPNYHIICLDWSSSVDYLEERGISIFCLEKFLGQKNILFRNTGVILNHPLVLNFIKEKSSSRTPYIAFFKPQPKIEKIAIKNNFKLIGNSPSLNKLFEDKISFFELCQKEKIPVPEGEIIKLSNLSFNKLKSKYGLPFIIQFGRGWAGNSTFIIKTRKNLERLKSTLPNLEVKVTRFIEGVTVLNNAVVYNQKVFFSLPAIQLKASSLLTSTQLGTGGRQWPAKLSPKVIKQINFLTEKVGQIMSNFGYKGFFGLDFIVEQNTQKVYVIENNARITYSAPFYTKLELSQKCFPLLGYHFLSFLPTQLGIQLKDYSFPQLKGSEIVAKNFFSKPIKISSNFIAGIYTQDLKLKKKTYFLESSSPEDLFIETAPLGKIINPETEYLKIDTLQEVADQKGKIKPEINKLISQINNFLKIENAQLSK